MKTVLVIFATLLATVTYCQSIVQLEYFLDTDAGFGKNKLVNVTTSLDAPVSFTADVAKATVGLHALYIRTRDSNNQWSHTSRRTIEVLKDPEGKSYVAQIEYFFDTDPGIGKASSITITKPQTDENFTIVIPAKETSPGPHVLFARVKNSPSEVWSHTQSKSTTIINCSPPIQPVEVASQTVCSGSTVTFTAQEVAGATAYQWAVPVSWTIVSGQGTRTIMSQAPKVATATTFTTLAVSAINSCDAGLPRNVSVTVNPLPAAPEITATATLLTSSVASGNQWLLNGVPIQGATAQTYQPIAAGEYTVQTTSGGCTSLPSVPYTFVVTAIGEPVLADVQNYPNPVVRFLRVINSGVVPIELRLYSLTGQLLLRKEKLVGNQEIDVDFLTTGSYILQLRQNDKVRRQILIKR